MLQKIGTIVALWAIFVGCSQPEAFDEPAPKPPQEVKTPIEKTTEALKTVETAIPNPPPVEKPVPAETNAVAPEEHQGFLTLEEITKNEAIQSIVSSMTSSGGEKQKRKDLKKLKSKGSYNALMRAMRSDDPNIRIQSARILRRLGVKSKPFTQALIAALRSDPDKDVRGMIAEVMVYYRNRATVPALIEVLLRDGGDGARTNAARALAAIKDSRSIKPLITALEDKDTWVRLRAAGALKRMGAKRAIPALVERLNDPNKRVQQRAHEALKALTGRAIGPDYDAWRKAYPAR